MIEKGVMLGFDDITIIPAKKSSIAHRSDCDVYREDGMLPIFASPMSSVIDDSNYKEFLKNKINVVIPRNIPLERRIELMHDVFVAVSLDEFDRLFADSSTCIDINEKKVYICIDIANGHMEYLHSLVLCAKKRYRKNLVLMVGSVANVELYRHLARIGVDYVRFGIGGGSICTTSVVSGVHNTIPNILEGMLQIKSDVIEEYKAINRDNNEISPDFKEVEVAGMRIRLPIEMVDYMTFKADDKVLEDENEIPKTLYTVPKVIVDGGINTFAKINKSLALGADYVMMGGMFAQTEEACGDIIDNNEGRFHVYYGMSTHRAQRECNQSIAKLKPEEGITKVVPIMGSLKDLVEKIIFYLREAMSLTNSRKLLDFNPENVRMQVISSSAFKEFTDNK